MYANAKRFDEAIVALEKVLELDPGAESARVMIQRIEKERGR